MRKPVCAFLFLVFCLVAVASGQGTTSRVTGTVQDANGAVGGRSDGDPHQ